MVHSHQQHFNLFVVGVSHEVHVHVTLEPLQDGTHVLPCHWVGGVQVHDGLLQVPECKDEKTQVNSRAVIIIRGCEAHAASTLATNTKYCKRSCTNIAQ